MAVLKISYPLSVTGGDAAVLRHFRGRGAVRLFESDDEACAILLGRVGPRTLDSVTPVDEAIEIAVGWRGAGPLRSTRSPWSRSAAPRPRDRRIRVAPCDGTSGGWPLLRELAEACCQARAGSADLPQCLHGGEWFAPESSCGP